MAKRWYIVHAYSNFERKVAEAIKERAAQQGLTDLFEEVLVPMEEVVETRRGRKVSSERKFFPGYVLVKMQMTDQAYHLIKQTPKVTGFLGTDNKHYDVWQTSPNGIWSGVSSLGGQISDAQLILQLEVGRLGGFELSLALGQAGLVAGIGRAGQDEHQQGHRGQADEG